MPEPRNVCVLIYFVHILCLVYLYLQAIQSYLDKFWCCEQDLNLQWDTLHILLLADSLRTYYHSLNVYQQSPAASLAAASTISPSHAFFLIGPPEGFRTLFSDLKGQRPSPSSPLGVYRLMCTRMREVEPSSKNQCYQHHYQTALPPTAIVHTHSGKAHVTGICSELGRPG